MSNSNITRQPHWLNKSRMAASLGISTQAFDKWGVEPVARIGREAFYDVRSVLENRLALAERKHQPEGDFPEGIDPLAEHKLTQERLRLTAAQADAQEKKTWSPTSSSCQPVSQSSPWAGWPRRSAPSSTRSP